MKNSKKNKNIITQIFYKKVIPMTQP